MRANENLDRFRGLASLLSDYSTFAMVPDEFKTPEGACGWMLGQIYNDNPPLLEFFSQIPPALVSDDLRIIALDKNSSFIDHIDPKDTDQYLALFLLAYKLCWKRGQTLQPHPDYQTVSTVEGMIALANIPAFERCIYHQPWIAQVMTPAQIATVSEASFELMLRFPNVMPGDRALDKHLKHTNNGYIALRKAKRLEWAACYVKSGGWPTPDALFESEQPRPKDIHEALKFIVSDSKKVCQALYMAWLMTQPIEHVIPQMDSRKLINLAMEMYSPEALRPYLKVNRHLKAALLEESLGL